MDEVVERGHLVGQHHRRPYLRVVVCLVATIFISGIAPAESSPVPEPAPAPAGCQAERAVTTPAPVDVAQVLGDVYALRDDRQAKLFSGPNPTLDRALTALFDLSVPKYLVDKSVQSRCQGQHPVRLRQSIQGRVQIISGEPPLERLGDRLMVGLEPE